MSLQTHVRNYAEGIGEAVADRTINRMIMAPCETQYVEATLPRRDDVSLDSAVDAFCKKKGIQHDGYAVIAGDQKDVTVGIAKVGEQRRENWQEVADRVALGNSLLAPEGTREYEYSKLYHHIAQANLLMSGRHLQHGDKTQPTRPMEVFTNCSTSAMSFISFYLLLNGSGVGRSYDDEMMIVDWSKMPVVRCVIDGAHQDVLSGHIHGHMDLRTAKHLYDDADTTVYKVEDSREGWAYAVAKIESMTYAGCHRDSVLLLDFSNVRQKGSPIGGMQGRPASGPGPLMDAIAKIAHVRDAGMEPWKATMFIDHYLAECVLVGGARRSARMATKTWRDKSVLEFCRIKRAIELDGLEGKAISKYVKTNMPMSFLYTSNNSAMVDQDFWNYVNRDQRGVLPDCKSEEELQAHAAEVLNVVAECSYRDGTGEPGLINGDKLTANMAGTDYEGGKFAESSRFKLPESAMGLAKDLAVVARDSHMPMITNPCGEICIYKLGGYCVIADVVPFHAQNLDDAEDAFRTATRALIRVNQMDAVYGPEVKRTNRIGVGMTGLHEYAFKFFGYGWKDIVNEDKSLAFWLSLSRFKRAVADEAARYAMKLGVTVPHTNTTMKPAGTTSKLFGLSEGAHLPSMREYLRWVQFRSDDPLVEEYRAKGYPVRELKIYSGTTIVGFPTQPTICTLGMGDKLLTAAEATPEEQYRYLELLEKYWIRGVEEDGITPLEESGNQVSYTLKYDPEKVGFEDFKRTLIEGQSRIRCCSVMPQSDTSAYEYQPEEGVNKEEFERISAAIVESQKEDIGMEHVDCGSGGCPISWNENDQAA